jgi:RNA processing factor Prp31
MEIKEVDEDKVEDTLGHGAVNSDSEKSRSEMDLKSKFEEFSRSLTQRRQSEKSLSRKRLDIMEMPLEKEMDSSLIELDDESDKVDKIVVDSVEEMDKVPGLRQTVQYPQGFIHKSRPSI